MTFSRLTKRTVPHHNKYSNRQGQAVTRVIPHHWAGVGGGDARLMNPNQKVSANYIIYSTGEIVGQVPEEFRAWTSGSFSADAPSITIEVQNSAGQINGNDNDPGSWKISDAALASLISLTADIAVRHRWGAVAQGNVRGHREFGSTACPGGYLWNKFGVLRQRAHAIAFKGAAPVNPPTTGKTVWQLADEVMAGLHGNGDARRRSLGANYAAVQAEVNRRFGQGPKAASKSIGQLADEVIAGVHGNGPARKKSLGANYAAVQAEVNRRLGASVAPKGPSISQLADAVLRGDYGNGEARKRALGSNYAAVQAEVNRRLR